MRKKQNTMLVFPTLWEAKTFLESFVGESDFVWSFSYYYGYALIDLPHPLIVVVTGMGMKRAEQSLNAAFDRFTHVDQVIGMGLCHGLIKSSYRGEVCVPRELMRLEQNPNAKSIESVFCDIPNSVETQKSQSWSRLISSEEPICTKADKAAIFSLHNFECADREAYAWGTVCKKKSVKYFVIKTLLEGGGEEISIEYLNLLDHYGNVSWKKVITNVWNNWHMLSELWQRKPKMIHQLYQSSCRVLKVFLESDEHQAHITMNLNAKNIETLTEEVFEKKSTAQKKAVNTEHPQLSLLDPF